MPLADDFEVPDWKNDAYNIPTVTVTTKERINHPLQIEYARSVDDIISGLRRHQQLNSLFRHYADNEKRL